jgi:hypothetical protein
LNASCTQVKEEELVRSLSYQIIEWFEFKYFGRIIRGAVCREAIGRHYFEEANNVGGATNWNLVDKSGNQVYLRTSSFADFATKIVPKGSGKVRGILQIWNGLPTLTTFRKDVMLTGKELFLFLPRF